jgi:hypothetical protein
VTDDREPLSAEGQGPAAEAKEEDELRRLREELGRLTVADHLLLMLQSLSTLALDRLGLTKESGGRRDFEQARLAIDAFKALMGALESVRPAEEMRGHRGMLAQLQMTYVATLEKSGETAAASAAKETTSEEAT